MKPENEAETSSPPEPETDDQSPHLPTEEVPIIEETPTVEAVPVTAETMPAIPPEPVAKGNLWQQITGQFRRFQKWLEDPQHKAIFFSSVAIAILLILAIPPIRCGLFNGLGVRVNSQVTVLDADSGLPLKGVSVKIGKTSVATDKEGVAKLGGLRLGSQQITIEKLAYAAYQEDITLGLGSNQLDDVLLQPTGVQYSFQIVDWLSQSPIESAEVSYGENSAISGEDGAVLLTIPPISVEAIDVTVVASGYRSETINIATTQDQALTVKLVLNKPHYFISKRTGHYDLYKIDLDGANEQLMLAGTGQESGYNIQLTISPDYKSVYLVASREGRRNAEGSLLYGLYKIDAHDGKHKKIDESEEIRLYGWSRSRLIYAKIAAGTSAGNAQRQRLISLNPQTDGDVELGASNYFNGVVVTDNATFYATNDYYSSDFEPHLYRANPTNGQNTVIHSGEVWTVLRSGYDELSFNSGEDWFKVTTAAGALPISLSGAPTEYLSRYYVTSPDGNQALWIDRRDGQTYLLSLNVDSAAEIVLLKRSDINYPILWVDDSHIIFRVMSASETADYIMDLTNKTPVKLADVTDVSVFMNWYYY